MRNLIILSLLLFAISCSEANLTEPEISTSADLEQMALKSKSINDIMADLEGIPVNIIQPYGKTVNRYLGYDKNVTIKSKYITGGNPNKDAPKLYDRDYGDGKQRWIINRLPNKIKGEYVYTIKTLVPFLGNGKIYLATSRTDTNGFHMADLGSSNTSEEERWIFRDDVNNPSWMEILSRPGYDGTQYGNHVDFQKPRLAADSYDGINVIGLNENLYNKYQLSKWEISPAETFSIVDIEYYMDEKSTITKMPDFITTANTFNSTSIVQEMNMTFSDKASETSDFTETEGVNITHKGGVSVGIPKIGIGGSYDGSKTSNKSWTYGSKQSKEDSRSYSFTVRIPARSSVTATASVQRYNVKVNYVVTFKGQDSGKIIKVLGEWTGVSASTITYKLVEGKTRKVLKTFEGTPNNVVDITKSL